MFLIVIVNHPPGLYLNKRPICALVKLANVSSEHLGMIFDLDLEKNYNFNPFFEKF